jgi:phospholipase/carboxylesterase
MTLETIELQTGSAPAASIIVLHGLGADGNDFVPIARELDLAAVGAVRFVFPHAPVRPVTINGGHRMRAWYDILGPDLARREDESGLRASCAAIQELLDREAGRGIAPARTVLMGFSQGCAMTLMSGVRAPQRLAGLAGLSGYLPLAGETAAERSSANQQVPIFLAHGRFDPVVAYERGTSARDALSALGYAVQWHEYGMQHSVCAEEVADLNRWLVKVLAPA